MDINAFFKGLSEIFDSGRIDQVSEYLRRHLREAEQEQDSGAVIRILNEMIRYFRSVSSYSEALDAAERALGMMRKLGLEQTLSYGTTLLNAATAYRASGDSAAALDLFETALVILKKELPEDDPRLAGLYNNLSALHQDTGAYDKALGALEQAVKIMTPLPELAIDLATVHVNLALLLSAMQRDDEAMQALHTAMRIFEREGAANPDKARKAPYYAAALAGFAAAHYKSGEFAKAVEIYGDALKRLKDCFGENRDYALTCRNCAEAYEALGDTKMAEALREKADRIMAVFC